MTAVVELEGGKQAVVNSDNGIIRLTLWANKGGLGVTLTKKEAASLKRALFEAIYMP